MDMSKHRNTIKQMPNTTCDLRLGFMLIRMVW